MMRGDRHQAEARTIQCVEERSSKWLQRLRANQEHGGGRYEIAVEGGSERR